MATVNIISRSSQADANKFDSVFNAFVSPPTDLPNAKIYLGQVLSVFGLVNDQARQSILYNYVYESLKRVALRT